MGNDNYKLSFYCDILIDDNYFFNDSCTFEYISHYD